MINTGKIALLIAFALPVVGFAQQNYTIDGQIGKLNKPAKAYLRYKIEGKEIIDSTFVNNGKFSFKGTIPSPMEGAIRVAHDNKPEDPKAPRQWDLFPFIIEGADIKIVATDSIKNATISGSPLNDENQKVNTMLAPIYAQYEELNKEYASKPMAEQQNPEYLQSLEDRAATIQKQTEDAKLGYISKSPKSYMALMALSSILGDGFDAVGLEKVFLELDGSLRDTELGRKVAERIAQVKKTQEGVEAPDFTQPDVDGNPVKLSDFRGKYVLLDFWASWCAPCRRENPNLVKSYAQFKDRGFEILGVSMDKATDKAKWLKAIQDDGLTWKQVGDLKGWDNEAGALYEVKAIPMNYLIDPEGKIIAKYLRGEELDNKLSEIFGK
ncbi:TlpA disulfide reductase family protein [Sphingobacterium hotanense]|uniref:TlpA disulfide reductase family protein n=1 Tax=Sphingobacterium hotanense TaxID=649196 RepID=UPI0021A45AEC|nr:TlpA disulfide reductase family protein [Sphingobacterium hotanense]MCT1524140.1 AhpC/TSA family protein [Sphingobacterium hotanense]